MNTHGRHYGRRASKVMQGRRNRQGHETTPGRSGDRRWNLKRQWWYRMRNREEVEERRAGMHTERMRTGRLYSGFTAAQVFSCSVHLRMITRYTAGVNQHLRLCFIMLSRAFWTPGITANALHEISTHMCIPCCPARVLRVHGGLWMFQAHPVEPKLKFATDT